MAFFTGRRKSDTDPEPGEPPKQPDRPERISTPPAPPAKPPSIGFETVLGATSKLEGSLSSDGNIRLDGIFNGTLEITGNVLVGETAKINADINARNISIAGAVRGNVSGNKVQLLRTGRVWGDITATALSTEEGAFIDGKISMQQPAPEPDHEAALPLDEEDTLEDSFVDTVEHEATPEAPFDLPEDIIVDSEIVEEEEEDDKNHD